MPSAGPRVVVAAGGTAGHVVPAMAVADELRARGARVSWLGTRERIEAELVPAAGYEIDFVKVRGIDRRNVARAARAGGRGDRRGWRRALGAAAAGGRRGDGRRRLCRRAGGVGGDPDPTPLVLTEADSHLGLANRLLARRAERVCLAFPIAGRRWCPLCGDGSVRCRRPSSLPTRGRRARGSGSGPEERVLLVVGGSQGARSVNFAALAAFAEREPSRRRLPRAHGQRLISGRDFAVMHLSGRLDYAELPARLDAAPDVERFTLLAYEPGPRPMRWPPPTWCWPDPGGSIFEIAAAGLPLDPRPLSLRLRTTTSSAQRRVDGATPAPRA